jgi:multidrug efflux pump
MCGLGIIALAGIVVNNNIVLIDTFNEFRKKGYPSRNAAYHAGLARFRPVLLTSITTILGLVPMVFGLTIKFSERTVLVGAPSSQWWTDMSSTIAGGLTFATILTLLATPALLVLGENVNQIAKNLRKKNSKSSSCQNSNIITDNDNIAYYWLYFIGLFVLLLFPHIEISLSKL